MPRSLLSLVWLLSVVAASAIAACGPAPAPHGPPAPSNTTPPAVDEPLAPLAGPVRVGVVLPMTGAQGAFGVSTEAGIRLAIRERNDAGGVRGARLELVVLDTMGTPAGVGEAVTRLIEQEHVVAILGEVTSGATLAAAEIAQARGVPLITPSATSASVTEVGDRIFRACFVDEAQGRAMARFARDELHVARAAILADTSTLYPVALAAAFTTEFAAGGGTIVLADAYQGGAIAPSVIGRIAAAKVDAVYLPGYYPDAAQIAIELRKLGSRAVLLGGDGWDSPELGAIAGAAIDGAYFTNHFAIDDPREITRSFAKRYAGVRGTPPDGLAALGYDAALVLLDALERTPDLDGAALAAAISVTSVEGVTGHIDLRAGRDPAKPVHVLELKALLPHFAASISP
ncbi:MAG TPA: ABC transporter substrate-binding protein [Kofleriaceae bacterium]|nr:ABC transporter substrate-binding protein [Kofleriaceae bacterium]